MSKTTDAVIDYRNREKRSRQRRIQPSSRRWAPVEGNKLLAAERGTVTGATNQGMRHLEFSDETGQYEPVERRARK